MSILEGQPLTDHTAETGEPVLQIRDLDVIFPTEDGPVHAVRGLDLDLRAGEVLGVVGESGSGKSVTMLAVLGLLPKQTKVTGSAKYRGEELLGRKTKVLRQIRGAKIAMIFQDPLSALNPVHKVGKQLTEAMRAHHDDMNQREASMLAVQMLDLVGIPQAGVRADQYPHEFSGGMRQRAMIAMAICNDPDVLIADEPTTALDVTIQAQILDVLDDIQARTNMAIVFITHDLGVIARVADRVQVMYAGRSAELADVDDVFGRSRHPYTRGLMASMPALRERNARLLPIIGSPPSMLHPPSGCAFHPRCPMARPNCATEVPDLRAVGAPNQQSACWYAEELGDRSEQR